MFPFCILLTFGLVMASASPVTPVTHPDCSIPHQGECIGEVMTRFAFVGNRCEKIAVKGCSEWKGFSTKKICQKICEKPVASPTEMPTSAVQEMMPKKIRWTVKRAVCAMQSEHIMGELLLTQNLADETLRVRIRGVLGGLTPGKHQMQVHMYGTISYGCSEVGPHFNPDGSKPMPGAANAGDIGDADADEDGVAAVDTESSLIGLFGGRDVIGRAIVLHGLADGSDENEKTCCLIQELVPQTNQIVGVAGD